MISVENLVIKYAPDLPAVLQDVSFTLKAGERVGLLGRTGSGKSTLAMSILRFVCCFLFIAFLSLKRHMRSILLVAAS